MSELNQKRRVRIPITVQLKYHLRGVNIFDPKALLPHMPEIIRDTRDVRKATRKVRKMNGRVRQERLKRHIQEPPPCGR